MGVGGGAHRFSAGVRVGAVHGVLGVVCAKLRAHAGGRLPARLRAVRRAWQRPRPVSQGGQPCRRRRDQYQQPTIDSCLLGTRELARARRLRLGTRLVAISGVPTCKPLPFDLFLARSCQPLLSHPFKLWRLGCVKEQGAVFTKSGSTSSLNQAGHEIPLNP